MTTQEFFERYPKVAIAFSGGVDSAYLLYVAVKYADKVKAYNVRGERCTPTGAALLKHFATRFGSMPIMKTTAIGYGMGKKDFEAANCVGYGIERRKYEHDDLALIAREKNISISEAASRVDELK